MDITETLTATAATVDAWRFFDADHNQVGLAISLPSGVITYGHDYDAQPLIEGFLYFYLDTADDIQMAERLVTDYIASVKAPRLYSPVCRHCGLDIAKEGDLWVDLLSGDLGGTYDYCTDNPVKVHDPVEVTR